MNASESGTADAPIILSREPSWGEGPAAICGSEAVTGWKKGAESDLIPEPEKVWHADLNWAPRNVWMVGTTNLRSVPGAVTRIPLARTPNWTITDPDDIQSQWWTWTLLNTDDFGGIETWQGGPAYVYDNISGNPGGYRNADLYVGGTPQGHNLHGAIDFLRIARGTLADAKTTIEELCAWEFNGPFLYDFAGSKRPADGGEAGAVDLADQ